MSNEMTLKYSRELSNLEYEEINRILKQLSNSIRRFFTFTYRISGIPQRY
jgi:hypothetical protein